MQKVSHRQGELQLQPPAHDVRAKAHPNSVHNPQGLPVSFTTKSENHTRSLKILPSHIPKGLKTAASPALQEKSGGTEMSAVTSSVS